MEKIFFLTLEFDDDVASYQEQPQITIDFQNRTKTYSADCFVRYTSDSNKQDSLIEVKYTQELEKKKEYFEEKFTLICQPYFILIHKDSKLLFQLVTSFFLQTQQVINYHLQSAFFVGYNKPQYTQIWPDWLELLSQISHGK
ncbi:Tn7 transposase TnsA N-terminal domain-containing protein [Sulfurimonas sp. NWX367]